MFSVRTHAEQQFGTYLSAFPAEEERLDALALQFAEDAGDIFIRSNMQGHITTSALVIDPLAGKVLIIHHKLFDRWLPPGGHQEGNGRLSDSALREAYEETGVQSAGLHEWHDSFDAPFDIDIHAIRAQPSKNEGDHYHHDFMYVFNADSSQALVAQLSEVFAAKWIPVKDFMALPGLRFNRLAEKFSLLMCSDRSNIRLGG